MHIIKLLRCYWFICNLLLPVIGWAQIVPPDSTFSTVGPIAYLSDFTGKLTISEVWQLTSQFRVADSPHRLLGVGRPLQWLRLGLKNRTDQKKTFVASLDYPYLDEARFYILTETGQLITNSGPLNWKALPHQRATTHSHPTFQFTFEPRQRGWVFAQIAGTSGPVVVTLDVQTARTFELQDRQERLFWSWTLGIFCWLIVISGILRVFLKEPVYGYYGLYILLITAYLMATKGFSFEWFPARQYGFVSARHLPVQLSFASVFAAFLFIRHYVLVSVWHLSWVRRIYYSALLPVGFDIVFICFELPFTDLYRQQADWIGPIVSACYLIPILIMFGLVSWQAVQEQKPKRLVFWDSPARLYLISISPIVIHITCTVLNNYGLIPNYFLPRFEGLAVAYLIEFTLLSVGMGYRYKHITDERQQLVQANFQQQLLLQQEQNRVLQAQLRLQQEKERIARDLHDHVGAQLSVIASSLDHVRLSQPPNGTALHLETIGNHARDAISSLRETIWAINREYVPLGEFQIQLQQYLHRQQQILSNTQLLIRANTVDTGQPLTSEQALNLFRIIQEAVSNALRHAHANTIQVAIGTDATSRLWLEVKDDGIGFDMSEEHPGHYGLLNMRLRAERLGGEWQITAQPGMGTTLSLIMPLQSVVVSQNALVN
ncbi:hypothetical protein GCM10027592_33530 [Spirosoma flavus]